MRPVAIQAYVMLGARKLTRFWVIMMTLVCGGLPPDYIVPDRKPHIFENMGTNPCLVLAFFGVICGQNFLLRHVVEIGSHLR